MGERGLAGDGAGVGGLLVWGDTGTWGHGSLRVGAVLLQGGMFGWVLARWEPGRWSLGVRVCVCQGCACARAGVCAHARGGDVHVCACMCAHTCVSARTCVHRSMCMFVGAHQGCARVCVHRSVCAGMYVPGT